MYMYNRDGVYVCESVRVVVTDCGTFRRQGRGLVRLCRWYEAVMLRACSRMSEGECVHLLCAFRGIHLCVCVCVCFKAVMIKKNRGDKGGDVSVLGDCGKCRARKLKD